MVRPMSERFVTLPEIRKEARRRLPRDVWNFGAGGAETETTLEFYSEIMRVLDLDVRGRKK